MNSSCSELRAGLVPRVKLTRRLNRMASQSGYIFPCTVLISPHADGAFDPELEVSGACGVESDDAVEGAFVEFSPDAEASKRGSRLPSQRVGSSVRARWRSSYQAEVAVPRCWASSSRGAAG